ncbi:hypothetical protein BIT28_02545 [Photobacterium proteolyticum]|uniref:Type II secretion system protein GspB C-terminal domain-containing protein n=1 Tax=Photobacterium proteolyticum TaxID=1903952 RepID=A0A1Q9GS63_9GAMM|nr:general secretion pathway protein GspB [Photobacterium proteolyticum]OLQ77500.1 hypothetical protein BIT28_02545 [Photobacterium proteolyticum]
MSNLLNAIAQSDQQNQLQPSLASRPVRQAAGARRVPSWLLPAVLVLTPVAATLAYMHYTHSSSSAAVMPLRETRGAEAVATASRPVIVTEPQVVRAEPALPTATMMTTTVTAATEPRRLPQILGEGESQIRFLPYPELRTEPLPSLNRQLASQTLAVPPSSGRAGGNLEEPKIISSEPRETEWGLDGLDYSELSPQLAQQLKSAIAATDNLPVDIPPEPEEIAAPVIEAVALGELPASVQNRIPPLNFETHIYSSVANSRWVKVNGHEAFEGDEIAPGVVLRRIEPRQVVFDFESYLIEMPALSEW